MKIRTLEQLEDLISDDLAWRKIEISAFDGQIRRSRDIVQAALLRASAALLYAHWEGFVKTALHSYSSFLVGQRLPQAKVRSEIVAMSFRSHFKRMEGANRITDYISFVESFRSGELNRLTLGAEKSDIDTQANLSSRVLGDLLSTFGIDSAGYTGDADLIDSNLLLLRNSIAHGERADLEEPEWRELRVGVVNLLDRVHVDVVNHAALKAYLSSAAA